MYPTFRQQHHRRIKVGINASIHLFHRTAGFSLTGRMRIYGDSQLGVTAFRFITLRIQLHQLKIAVCTKCVRLSFQIIALLLLSLHGIHMRKQKIHIVDRTVIVHPYKFIIFIIRTSVCQPGIPRFIIVPVTISRVIILSQHIGHDIHRLLPVLCMRLITDISAAQRTVQQHHTSLRRSKQYIIRIFIRRFAIQKITVAGCKHQHPNQRQYIQYLHNCLF